jgi:hypothetical protein
MTRFRVWLSSMLNKLLPNVLAEPARFYFWRFLRPRPAARRSDIQKSRKRLAGLLATGITSAGQCDT